MKNKIILFFGVFFFGFCQNSHAILNSDVGKIHGEVVNIDEENKQISIKDYATERNVILKTPNGLNKDIIVGNEVAATYDLEAKDDTKSLRFIKIISSSY